MILLAAVVLLLAVAEGLAPSSRGGRGRGFPRRLGASGVGADQPPRNIVGGALQPCSFLPLTGYLRDGFCQCSSQDEGQHTVCIRCTERFLLYSKSVGNDLSTPMPQYGFQGLQPGDSWCLCASRFSQALHAGAAPEVVIAATHASAADIVGLDELLRHATAEPVEPDEMQ